MRAIVAAMLAAGLVGGCGSQQTPIGGLLSSNAQFTSSDDRCTISMLFDNFQLRRPSAGKLESPTRVFALAGGDGWPVRVTVKGAKFNTGPGSTLSLKIGTSNASRPMTGGDGNFDIVFEGRLDPRQTRFEVTVAPGEAAAAGKDMMIAVDSLDLTIDPPGKSCA